MSSIFPTTRRTLSVLFLGTLVACSGSNNNDNWSDSNDDNITEWSVDAGESQSAVSGSTVLLEGSTTLPADQTTAIKWTQVEGVDVTLTDDGQLSASFVAPRVDGNTDLSLQLSVTDTSGKTLSDQVTVTVSALPRISLESVTPDFGLAGTAITIGLSEIPQNPVVALNSQQIVPTDIDTASNTLSFVVPEGAESGPLRVTSDSGVSNIVYFPVSDTGVLPPAEDAVVVDELGNNIAVGHILVSLTESSNNEDEAARLATLVSGEIVGRIPLVNGWQIQLNTTTLEDLRAVATALESEASVAFTVMDVEIQPDTIDWSNDPDRSAQRLRNRVEEGVALYESAVHPTVADKVRPSFMTIGVSESGVDFNHPDFSGYVASGVGASDNVSIYSPQSPTTSVGGKHGSNVTGIIAAELGDQGNAGPVRALSTAHGGANISVGINIGAWGLGRLAKTNQQLEAGTQVINWSWGVHLDGTLDCSNNAVTNNRFSDEAFANYAAAITTFFGNLATDYPLVTVVTSAGNGATNAGDSDSRLPSSVESNQLIVVGAHTSGGNFSEGLTEDERAETADTACFDTAIDTDVKRTEYSNYGERVDIAASGTIMGLSNDTYANGNRGTSYATPLVTATIALMQSINPNLTPAEIRYMLRSSALPIENKVTLTTDDSVSATVFTRPIQVAENSDYAGQGARLNVEGAVQAALDSLAEETVTITDPVAVAIGPGVSEVTQTISLTIPDDQPIFDKVDIMFVVDLSGSYSGDLAVFRDKANDLTDAFGEAGSNVALGLSSFSDFPQSPYGSSNDFAFNLDLALTTERTLVKDALDDLRIRNGNDTPESQLEAIYQTAQAATGWRPNALPVLFLATDARFHDSDVTPAYPGKGFTATLAALHARSARVFGLQAGGSIDDVLRLTEATGGEAFQLSSNSEEIVETVVAALESTTSNVTVQLEPSGDFASLVKSITPKVDGASPGDPITGVNAGDTVEFDAVFTKGAVPSGSTQTFSFRLKLIAEDIAVIQEVPITVVIN